jgi:hypothetical protein
VKTTRTVDIIMESAEGNTLTIAGCPDTDGLVADALLNFGVPVTMRIVRCERQEMSLLEHYWRKAWWKE